MAKTNGGCLCGKIRYESDAGPQMTILCHCKDCQRQTGSAYAINRVMPTAPIDNSMTHCDGNPDFG